MRNAGFCLGLWILFTSLACERQPSNIGLFLYNEADPYIRVFGRQIMDFAPATMNLEKFDAANSQPIQNEQLEGWLSRKPAVMVVNPVDRLGAYALIHQGIKADVPIIFFNREPLAQDMAAWDKAWYVGAKAAQSGQLQAGLVMKLFGDDPARLNQYDRNGDNIIQAIILKGEQGHQDAEIRTREVLRSFEKRGFAIEVLAVEVANWNQLEAYEKTGRLWRQHQGQLELIISNNDAMALGAINRLRQAGLFRDTNGNGRIDRFDGNWLPVVGIDGLLEAEQSIAEGFLYGTVKNDSLTMALAIVELADILMGRREQFSIPVTIENERYIWVDYLPFVTQD